MHTNVYTRRFTHSGVSDISDYIRPSGEYIDPHAACLINDILLTKNTLHDTVLAWAVRMGYNVVTPCFIHTNISETKTVSDLMALLTLRLESFSDQSGVCDRIRDIIRGHRTGVRLNTTALSDMLTEKEITIIEKRNGEFSVINIQFSRGETSWYDWLMNGHNISVRLLIVNKV